jgi:hypothetical protein
VHAFGTNNVGTFDGVSDPPKTLGMSLGNIDEPLGSLSETGASVVVNGVGEGVSEGSVGVEAAGAVLFIVVVALPSSC